MADSELTEDSDKKFNMKKLVKKITPVYKLYLKMLHWKRKLRDRLTIPGYEIKRSTIRELAKKYNCTNVFIETGTYMGDTVDFLKNDFEQLFSIELNQELATKAAKRFEAYSNIRIVQGDSTDQLVTILSNIQLPVTFWLDGHYSSEYKVGDEYIVTGKGVKDTPVMEELHQIKKHSNKRHVILIDDARLFNGKDDYPTKEEVKLFVKTHLPNHTFSIKKDIIRILPRTNE